MATRRGPVALRDRGSGLRRAKSKCRGVCARVADLSRNRLLWCRIDPMPVTNDPWANKTYGASLYPPFSFSDGPGWGSLKPPPRAQNNVPRKFCSEFPILRLHTTFPRSSCYLML